MLPFCPLPLQPCACWLPNVSLVAGTLSTLVPDALVMLNMNVSLRPGSPASVIVKLIVPVLVVPLTRSLPVPVPVMVLKGAWGGAGEPTAGFMLQAEEVRVSRWNWLPSKLISRLFGCWLVSQCNSNP